MDALIKILREFPAIWLAIGSIVTVVAIAVFYITLGKKITPMYANTVTDMARVHELQIEAHERVLEMQKVHYEAEIFDLKTERDRSRDRLLARIEEDKANVVRIAELESRPNVDKVYKHQEEFFTSMLGAMKEQGETMRAIHSSIMTHDERLEKMLSKAINP